VFVNTPMTYLERATFISSMLGNPATHARHTPATCSSP